MSPDQATAQYRAVMACAGETVTLRRIKQGATFGPTGPLLARITRYQADGRMYDLQQGERMVILLADDVAASGFPLPLLPNSDKLIWNGTVLTIKAVDDDTRRVGDVTIAYEVRVAGA